MKKICALAILACSLNACATIMSGGSAHVNLTPSDAGSNIKAEVVSSQGVQNVVLPTTINLPKGNNTVTINVKGNQCYNETSFSKSPTVNPWVFANIITGGTTGTTTDTMSGALWTYDEVVIVPVSKNNQCR